MQSLDLSPDAARDFLHQALAFLPEIVKAFAIILLGWLLAKAIRFAVERGLRAVNFNVLTERAGTDHFLQQGGLRGDTTTLFGLFAYWLVILAALMSAAHTLGLPHVADVLHQIVLFSPKLLVAMLAVVFGSYFARFVGSAVTTYCVEARVPDAALDAAVLPHGGLALDQLLQIIQMRALLLGGFGGQGLVMALDVGQLQTLQLRVQSRLVTRGHDRLPRKH